MTELNNTNAGDERTNPAPGGNGAAGNARKGPDLGNLNEAWAAFQAEHKDDLDAVASSRNAKRFEKHAERREKEMLLHVRDLDPSSFSRTGSTHGPRDFTGSSWLDADTVLDAGEDFVPPNPSIGPVRKSKLVFWIMLIAGVAGIIVSAFLPFLTWILSPIFGLCMLIGAGGLIVQHKGHTETREDEFDDGARV
ncbi:hypothetical protein JS528_01875 [Bifidobacterium sp. MA2]|uniref:Membrane associated protein n=1 Tax=Bifidobacterium santillanense TaxID=2809028 RepID=A0ABS5UML4_9BIFI|nr:hypothetical protein [Bifidobacterium santillanense]MBT1172126.1 hypothetical protein [Bifidobacterium santillanense]